jgi:endonuclease YncB( thermonuclease family)
MSELLFNYRVKELTKIVDGDTIDVILDVGFDILYGVRIRLQGIDTPEKRTSDPIEKVFGYAATKRLTELITDKNLVISTELDGRGKFGRVLGTIYANGTNVNELMVFEHYAVAYHGQNKDDIEAEHLVNRGILLSEGKVVL